MVLQADSHPLQLNHQELKTDFLQEILNSPPKFKCFHTDDKRHKMITNSREKDFPAKKEAGETSDNKIGKAGSSSSRQWLGLKDPRVVRVSRSFGGKDRHSKVCTIRGLRDRRVRLSVSTAIQLYDLQDRLGLNQPSKVVDWLLNAAKHEINELPPLPMPPGNFDQFPISMIVPHEGSGLQSSLSSLVDANIDCVKNDGSQSLPSSKEAFKIHGGNVEGDNQTTPPKSTKYWNLNAPWSNCNEVAQETMKEKSNWIKRDKQVSQEVQNAKISYPNALPRAINSSFPGLLNTVMPYNSYYHWDPSNLSLSHFGNHGYSIQSEDPHNSNVLSMPSPLSLPSASQLLFCPPATQPSFFPPYVSTQVECNPKQISHFQMLSSSSQNLLANSLTPSLYSISGPPMRLPQFSMTPEFLHSQNSNGSQSNKGNSGPSSAFTSSSFQNDPKATFG